jgi:hypothetical protein
MNFVEEGRQQALACMSSLVRTKDSRMEYELAQCQRMQDENTGDCGVLCIAFAVCIANGRDPTTLFFQSEVIRAHLRDCFLSLKYNS